MGINILEWGLLEEVLRWGFWWGVAIDMMVWGGVPKGTPIVMDLRVGPGGAILRNGVTEWSLPIVRGFPLRWGDPQ